MRISIVLIVLFSYTTGWAQYRHFDNFELQLGFKNQKAEPGRFEFRYEDDSITIGRGVQLRAPDMQILLGGGMEFELNQKLYMAVKGEVNITNARGGGVQLGAGYRLKLNYFLRLQPELLFSWAMITDTIGYTGYTPSELILNDIRFWPGYQLTAFYKSQQYGIQPKLSLVAEFSERWEFRYTMMYQMNLVYNQAIQLRGNISPTQTTRTAIPFRDELLTTKFRGEPLEKPLYRPSGFTVRAGFAYKLPLNKR